MMLWTTYGQIRLRGSLIIYYDGLPKLGGKGMLRIVVVSAVSFFIGYLFTILGTWFLVKFFHQSRQEIKHTLWISVITAWIVVMTKIAGLW
ncbi:MAG: hypothetical protein OWR62_15650 [Sulfobacillus thermotolerans]|nr:hypothetical protein [Sulfobacillus thermotolerans]